MKKIIAIALASAMVLSLAACASQPAATQAATQAAATEAAKAGELKDTGKLVFYASWSSDRTDPLVQRFTELTGIQVEVVTGGTSELISRIVAEKDNPLGDVLWGGTCTSYVPVEEYLEAYDTTEIGALEASCIDPEHKWYGFSIEPMLVVYNTKLVTGDDIPTGWKDLIDPKWKGKIAVVDPTKSSAAFGTMMAIMQAYGKEDGKGKQFIKDIIANTDGNILTSSSLSYKGVADGEFMIGLTGEESALKYIHDGADLGMVYPEEGTDAIVSPIAIIKGGPNAKSAQLFVDYMLGKEVQSQLAGWGIRSSRTDIDETDDFTPLDQIKQLPMDNEWIVAHGDEFKDFWRESVTE
ncbi:MAG: extracellular solute-binding protein [Lachnospiraceae bacterium]|nr:extracellular solute-binding protein [Lachnospiraceae bacterium]